jgi:hypothetical protein
MFHESYHAKRVTEMNKEAEVREYLMKVVRSEVVRPELKKRALKLVMSLDYELAMAEITGVELDLSEFAS